LRVAEEIHNVTTKDNRSLAESLWKGAAAEGFLSWAMPPESAVAQEKTKRCQREKISTTDRERQTETERGVEIERYHVCAE
jgi:hypothetical protein